MKKRKNLLGLILLLVMMMAVPMTAAATTHNLLVADRDQAVQTCTPAPGLDGKAFLQTATDAITSNPIVQGTVIVTANPMAKWTQVPTKMPTLSAGNAQMRHQRGLTLKTPGDSDVDAAAIVLSG
jgi:hypothetical protein